MKINIIIGDIMEIKYNQRSFSYPSLIKGLIHEVTKKDFDYFQLVYSDITGDFHKEEDTLIEFREDHIKGTVTADEDGILFTSIAWEPGWTIKVDGEKIEAVQLAEALVGIPVTAGTHTIEMSFFPKGMAVGIMMSIAGVIIVVMIGILEKRKQPVLLNRLYED